MVQYNHNTEFYFRVKKKTAKSITFNFLRSLEEVMECKSYILHTFIYPATSATLTVDMCIHFVCYTPTD